MGPTGVSGKVLYKGQPLPYGSVQFMTPAGVFVSQIAADGSYSLAELPTGLSKISVTCQDPKYAAFMHSLAAAGKGENVPKRVRREDNKPSAVAAD